MKKIKNSEPPDFIKEFIRALTSITVKYTTNSSDIKLEINEDTDLIDFTSLISAWGENDSIIYQN